MENLICPPNPDPFTEHKVVPISVEVINVTVLLIGVYQMYFGIEIGHPIYGLLFLNLVLALVSSLINIFIFPFLTDFKYSTIVSGNNITYLVFYLSCWCVLSVLRYGYIIHNHWIHEKFQESRTLLKCACISVCIIFVLSYSTILFPILMFGWPHVKLYNMTTYKKTVGILLIFINFSLLLGSSCIFYIAILRKRGKLGQNKITSSYSTEHGVEKQEKNKNELTLAVGNLPMHQVQSEFPLQVPFAAPKLSDFGKTKINVQNHSSRSNIHDLKEESEISLSQNHPTISNSIGRPTIGQSQMQFDKKEAEKLNAEITASIRSLETNLVLVTLIIATFLFGTIFSEGSFAIIFIVLKGFTPVLTTIANFGKIRLLFTSYCENFKDFFKSKFF
jgi:hypothetical protein